MRFIMIFAPLIALISSAIATQAFGQAHFYAGVALGFAMCFTSGVLLGRNIVLVTE